MTQYPNSHILIFKAVAQFHSVKSSAEKDNSRFTEVIYSSYIEETEKQSKEVGKKEGWEIGQHTRLGCQCCTQQHEIAQFAWKGSRGHMVLLIDRIRT